MAATPRIAQEDADGVLVLRFLDRQLYDDKIVREAADQVNAAIAAISGPIRIILDFQGVGMVSSALLGKLVMFQRKVDASKGMMRLCELSSSVQDVLKTTSLDRVLKSDRDRLESREHFGTAR